LEIKLNSTSEPCVFCFKKVHELAIFKFVKSTGKLNCLKWRFWIENPLHSSWSIVKCPKTKTGLIMSFVPVHQVGTKIYVLNHKLSRL